MLQGSVREVVGAAPKEVFAVVTDLERLPEWNELIQGVVERPAVLAPEAEWVVELRAMGNRWRSRSRVLEYDAGARRFVYRTQTDDGNPSFAIWTWQVDDDPAGARVSVRWELYPETFWRRALLGRIRNRQLHGEVRASIHAASRVAEPA
jgi:hypothetical protein